MQICWQALMQAICPCAVPLDAIKSSGEKSQIEDPNPSFLIECEHLPVTNHETPLLHQKAVIGKIEGGHSIDFRVLDFQ